MSEQTDLLSIIGTENPQRIADVIFIHGLGGDARGTWHPEQKKDDDDFWPMWLGKDLENLGIWSLAYEVEPSKWKGNTMPLVDRATNVLAYLEINDIGERPVIFITHSMGGLLVKQILRHGYDFGNPSWKEIVVKTKGIVYLSTPHSGANLASWLKYVGGFLGTSVSVKELEANGSRLRELNLLYRNHSVLSKIPLEVYFERRKTSGVMVVNETSADPGMPRVIPIPMDEDHISICRPESKNSLIYRRVKRFIKKKLADNSQIEVEKQVEQTYREKVEEFVYQDYGDNERRIHVISRQSLNELQQSLGISPERAEAIEKEVRETLLKYEEKIQKYKTLLIETLKPENILESDLLNNKIRQKLKNYQDVLGLEDKTIGLVYTSVGNGLLEQNKLQEATAAFKEAITLSPENAGGYISLGVVLLKKGETRKGIENILIAQNLLETQGKYQEYEQVKQFLLEQQQNSNFFHNLTKWLLS